MHKMHVVHSAAESRDKITRLWVKMDAKHCISLLSRSLMRAVLRDAVMDVFEEQCCGTISVRCSNADKNLP